MRLALNVVMQNDGDFVDLILVHTAHKFLIRNHAFCNTGYHTSVHDPTTANTSKVCAFVMLLLPKKRKSKRIIYRPPHRKKHWFNILGGLYFLGSRNNVVGDASFPFNCLNITRNGSRTCWISCIVAMLLSIAEPQSCIFILRATPANLGNSVKRGMHVQYIYIYIYIYINNGNTQHKQTGRRPISCSLTNILL